MSQTNDRSSYLIIGLGIIVTIALLMHQRSNLTILLTKLEIFSPQTRPTQIVKIHSKIHIHELVEVKIPMQELFMEKQEQKAEHQVVPQTNYKKARDLNEQGVALVLQRNYWDGLYHFDQAIQLDPSQIIPMINMAVTLTEMGMSRPATRYIAMAETVEPQHPWLQKNFPKDSEFYIANDSVRITPLRVEHTLNNEIIMQ